MQNEYIVVPERRITEYKDMLTPATETSTELSSIDYIDQELKAIITRRLRGTATVGDVERMRELTVLRILHTLPAMLRKRSTAGRNELQ